MDFAHQALSYSKRYERAIKRVTSPLRQTLGLQYFSYHTVSDTGDYRVLIDRPDWGEYYLDRQFYMTDHFLTHPGVFTSQRQVLLEADFPAPFKPHMQEIYQLFGFEDNYMISRRLEDRAAFYFFATDKNNVAMRDAFMNKPFLFEQFIHYFHQECAPFLDEIEAEPISLLPVKGERFYDIPQLAQTLEDGAVKELLGAMGAAQQVKAYLGLTSSQQRLLASLHQHHGVKSVAADIGLSPKTVENYLCVIREKLECFDKASLIEKAKTFDALGLFSLGKH